ncbi:MAG: hypothetical protein QW743_00585 [Candidatus Methanomethylicia archaeon]
MGISTPITTIILSTIIILTITTTYHTLLTQSTTIIQNQLNTNIENRNTILTIENVQIQERSITLKLRNIAGNPIIFGGETYKWCSFIISYKSQNEWVTTLIENYTITKIEITGTSITTTNTTLNPGQEATITINIPPTNPPIPPNTIVKIVFTTNNGVKTTYVGAR